MLRPLFCKLEQFAKVSDDDKEMLSKAVSNTVDYGPREDIISQGDRPDHVHLVIEGWAGRYKLLPETPPG